MDYKVILEKCGRTVEVTINSVKSEDEAKMKALKIISEDEEGFSVSRTIFLCG